MTKVIPPLPHIPYVPADLVTKGVVDDLVAICDLRSSCTREELSSTICAVLGMRGLSSFKIIRESMTKGQKVAVDQILEHLHGDLIQRLSGNNTYKVTTSPKLKPTMVRPNLPNTFPFRVTGQFVTYPSAVGVPCAEAVTLISGNRACKLTMPDVATTFQYLLNNQDLPVRLSKLEPLDRITGGQDFTKQYREVVGTALLKSGYLGLLVPDDSDTALTFVVTSQYAHQFPTFLETITRHWFREWKFDLVKFYCELEDNLGAKDTILGEPTLQLLRSKTKGFADAV